MKNSAKSIVLRPEVNSLLKEIINILYNNGEDLLADNILSRSTIRNKK